MARTLAVSADLLLFDENERDPIDDLRFQFDAIAQLDADEQKVIKTLIDAMFIRHQSLSVISWLSETAS